MLLAGLLGLQYDFRWSGLGGSPFGCCLLQGVKNTIILSLLAWVIALVLGIALGILRTAPWRVPRAVATAYVEFFRNTPLLVQLYRHGLIPVGLRIVIPPMATEFLSIFKNSSLAVTIGFAEITFQTQ